MNKNLMDKMIKSNDINRGKYTYVYGGDELAEIVTRGQLKENLMRTC